MSIRYEEGVCRAAETLAENVRRLRKARGWTQQQLGEKIGPTWPQERISEAESGRFDKVLSAVEEIARAFRVPVWQLLKPRDEGSSGVKAGNGGSRKRTVGRDSP